MPLGANLGGLNPQNVRAVLRDSIEMLQLLEYMMKREVLPLHTYADVANAYKCLADAAVHLLAQQGPLTAIP